MNHTLIKKYLLNIKNIIFLFLLIIIIFNVWQQIFTTSSPMGAYGSFGDESIIIKAAQRILHGQIPHLDFYSFMPGTSYYPLAAWMSIFGEQYSSVLWFNFLSALLLIGSIIWLGSLFSRWIAITAGLIFAFMIFPLWPFISLHWQFLFCINIATRLVLGKRKAIELVLAGIFLSWAGLTLINKAIFIAPIILSLVLLKNNNLERKKSFLLFITPPIIIGLVIVIILSTQNLWPPVWTQIVINNIVFYPKFNPPLSIYQLVKFFSLAIPFYFLFFLKPWPQAKWKMPYLIFLFIHTALVLSIFYHIEFFHFTLISSFFYLLLITSLVIITQIIWQKFKIIYHKSNFSEIIYFYKLLILAILIILVGWYITSQSIYFYKSAGINAPKKYQSEIKTPQGIFYLNQQWKMNIDFNKQNPLVKELPILNELLKNSLAKQRLFFFPYAPGYYYFYKIENPSSYDILPSPYLPPADLEKLKNELLSNADKLIFIPKSWPGFDVDSELMQWMIQNFPKEELIDNSDIKIYSKY